MYDNFGKSTKENSEKTKRKVNKAVGISQVAIGVISLPYGIATTNTIMVAIGVGALILGAITLKKAQHQITFHIEKKLYPDQEVFFSCTHSSTLGWEKKLKRQLIQAGFQLEQQMHDFITIKEQALLLLRQTSQVQIKEEESLDFEQSMISNH